MLQGLQIARSAALGQRKGVCEHFIKGDVLRFLDTAYNNSTVQPILKSCGTLSKDSDCHA